MKYLFAPLAVAFAAAVALSSTTTATVAATVPVQDDALVEQGIALYDKYSCDKCHRIGRRGARKGPLDGVGSKLTEEEIRNWFVNPAEMEAQMEEPPTGSNSMANTLDRRPLAEEEVDALTAYMLTLTD